MDERQFEIETGHLPRVRPTACPNCGGKMGHGTLRTPGKLDSRVFVEGEPDDAGEESYHSLDAWICKNCGYVELHALPSRDQG